GGGKGGLESDRFSVVGKGSVYVAFLEKAFGPAHVGRKVVRLEPDRLAAISDGFFNTSSLKVGQRPVVIRHGVGKQPNRLSVVLDSSVEIVGLPVDLTPVLVGQGKFALVVRCQFWVQLDRLGVGGDSPVQVALLEVSVR